MKKGTIGSIAFLVLVATIGFAPASTAANAGPVVWGQTATATTTYSSEFSATQATGAPDARNCADTPGQAWTYASPWVDSQLEVNFGQDVVANSLVVYFSNDLEDSVLIEIADENGNYTELNTITGTYTCESNLDTEYPHDIRFEFALNGTSKVSKVRFTILTQSDYPEIDAVGLVKPAIATKVGQSPIVIGNPKVGEYLGAVTNDDTWTGSPKPVVTYQWFACTKAGTKTATAKPADCTAITGATRIFIKLKAAQKGKYLRIRVSGTNPGATKSIYSKSTAKVK